MQRPGALSILAASLAAACSTADASGRLYSVLWTQTAAEHDALCEAVFAGAIAAIRARTAQPATGKPPAVIVDVDETMLDNSVYQAGLVRDGTEWSAATWQAWCLRAQATAVPGAVAFATECQTHGVTVFYVTNRERDCEDSTRANLRACGLPVAKPTPIDTVLCRGEFDADASKQRRRDHVAADFDVLLLLGDDLGDFLEPAASLAERRRQQRDHAADWGQRWFVLPNPMYGSWERALSRGAADPAAARFAALMTPASVAPAPAR